MKLLLQFAEANGVCACVRVCVCVCVCSSEIAVACGHFAASLQLCVEAGDDPGQETFSK